MIFFRDSGSVSSTDGSRCSCKGQRRTHTRWRSSTTKRHGWLRLAVGERTGSSEFAEIVEVRVAPFKVLWIVHRDIALRLAPCLILGQLQSLIEEEDTHRTRIVEATVATLEDVDFWIVYLGVQSVVEHSVPRSKVFRTRLRSVLVFRIDPRYHLQGRSSLRAELAVKDENDLFSFLPLPAPTRCRQLALACLARLVGGIQPLV